MAESKDINIVLGNNIKYMRKKKKITRERLAEEVNVSSRFLADVENGKVGVSLSTLKSLCHVLNTSADYLLGISYFNDKSFYINSIENRIKPMNENMLKNLECIIDCIIDIDKNSNT